LRRVSARTVVDPVATFGPATTAAIIAARSTLALATPTATATGLLTIIDQVEFVLSKGFSNKSRCAPLSCRIRTAGRSVTSPNFCRGKSRLLAGVRQGAFAFQRKMRSYLRRSTSGILRSGQALFVRSNQAAVVPRKILAASDQKSVRFEKPGNGKPLGRTDLYAGDSPRQKQVFQLRNDDAVIG
jgi:hypothetical protein